MLQVVALEYIVAFYPIFLMALAQEKIACILDVCCKETSQETPVLNFPYVSWE